MGLRPGRCTRKVKRPWTRVSQKKPKRSYVVGVPGGKIHIFEMGNKAKNFDSTVYLVSTENVQIRDNALEASRVVANKYLERTIGKENYFMKVLLYPHQILREHTLATGAGADRFSMGMRKAFGKPKGRAAVVNKGKKIMVVKTNKKFFPVAKESLKRAQSKLSGVCRVVTG